MSVLTPAEERSRTAAAVAVPQTAGAQPVGAQPAPGGQPSRAPAPGGAPHAAGATACPGPAEMFILGFRFHPCTGRDVVAMIASAVATGTRRIICNANLHGLASMYRSPAMAQLFLQDDVLVMIDSMPLLFLAWLRGRFLPRAARTTSLDFYDLMFAEGVAKGWKFGFIGATDAVLEQGLERLRQRFPGLKIDGRAGYFDMADRRPESVFAQNVEWLKREAHDVLIVGMGMPRQEEWIAAVQHDVPTLAILPAGAYLDYQVGAQRPAPRWMGQVGLEWAFRLAQSPRRLSYRYLVEPLLLAMRLVTRRHPHGAYRREAEG